VFFLAWVLASVILSLYETAIDTLFFCFLLDCEKNNVWTP
jgi:hypothetical protein